MKKTFFIILIQIFILFIYGCTKVDFAKDITFNINHQKHISDITKEDLSYENPKNYHIEIISLNKDEQKNEVSVVFKISNKGKKFQKITKIFKDFSTKTLADQVKEALNNTLAKLVIKDNNDINLPPYFYKLDQVIFTNSDKFSLIKDNFKKTDNSISFHYYLMDPKTMYTSNKKEYKLNIKSTKEYLDEIISSYNLEISDTNKYIWEYELDKLAINSKHKELLKIDHTPLEYNYNDNTAHFTYWLSFNDDKFSSNKKQYLIKNFKPYTDYLDYLEANIGMFLRIDYDKNKSITDLKKEDFSLIYNNRGIFTNEIISLEKGSIYTQIKFRIYLKTNKAITKEFSFKFTNDLLQERLLNDLNNNPLTLKDTNPTYLFDITKDSLTINNNKYLLDILELQKDFINNTLKVVYRIKDIELGITSKESKEVLLSDFISNNHDILKTDLINYLSQKEGFNNKMSPSYIASLIKTNYEEEDLALQFNKISENYSDLLGQYNIILKGEYKKLSFDLVCSYNSQFKITNKYLIKKDNLILDKELIIQNKLFPKDRINKLLDYKKMFKILNIYNQELDININLNNYLFKLNVLEQDLVNNRIRFELILRYKFIIKSSDGLKEEQIIEVFRKEYTLDYPSIKDGLNYLANNHIEKTNLNLDTKAASEYYQYIENNKNLNKVEELIQIKDLLEDYFGSTKVDISFVNLNQAVDDLEGELSFNYQLTIRLNNIDFSSDIFNYHLSGFKKINASFLKDNFSIRYIDNQLKELKDIFTKYFNNLSSASFTNNLSEVNLKVAELQKTLFKPAYYIIKENKLNISKVKEKTIIKLLNEDIVLEQYDMAYNEDEKLFKGILDGNSFKFAIKSLKIDYQKAYFREEDFNNGLKKIYLEFDIFVEQANGNIVNFKYTAGINL